MAQQSRSRLRADRMYCIERRSRDTPCRRSWVTTQEQAWEALRVQLLDDMAAAADGHDAYRDALAELEGAGPQPEGWHVGVHDRTYGYGPHAVACPEGISRGEAALLLAITATQP
jgi:hypothetical protein